MSFLEALRQQRWDDHRYYHQSRVNQALHFFSAVTFLVAYMLLSSHPTAAVLLGWLVAMCARQVGHFFFEPKHYDSVNGATHEEKEAIKIGFNLQRKLVLLSIWALAPLALRLDPSLGGVLDPGRGFVGNLSLCWLVIACGGILFRTVQLFFIRDVQTGLVWAVKILTDPLHDVKMYHRAPLRLLRGEWLDPMTELQHARRHA